MRRSLIVGLVCLMVFAVTGSGLAYDFGGRTIIYADWDDRTPPEGSADYERLLEAEEKYNVNFEYGVIPVETMVEQVLAGVLGGEAPMHLLAVQSWNYHYVPLAVQGALQPLDQVLPEDYFDSLPAAIQGRDGLRSALDILGHTYGTIGLSYPYETAIVMVWNKDLFEREGFPSLYDLIDEGEWTWEKLEEIAIKATRDTDGDGQVDQWGVGGVIGDPGQFAMPALATNNVYPTAVVDGKVKVTLNDPRTFEILDVLYRLWSVHQAVAPGPWHDPSPFNQGKVAMYFVPFWMQQLFDRNSVDWGLAYLPKGSAADDYVFPLYGLPVLVVPKTSEDPEALLALFADIYPEERLQDIMDAWAANQYADRESYAMFYEMVENWVNPTPWQAVFQGDDWKWTNLIWQIMGGVKSSATAIAEYEPVIQSALDDLLGQ